MDKTFSILNFTHNATRERVPDSTLPNYNKRNVKTMKYEV